MEPRTLLHSRIIVFMNNKGGVGKTTQAYNTAKNLLRNGRKVICVDFDQQEQLSSMLPDITRSDLKAEDLPDLECDYVIVDTGPTFTMEHLDLMDVAEVIIIPLQLESMDIEQSVKLLKTIKRSNHQHKAKMFVTHSGKHTLMYKTLMPALKGFSDEFGIEIMCEMRKSQAVAQANMQRKTVFEIQSPPEVRKEYKTYFKELGKVLGENTANVNKAHNGGDSCHAH